MATIDIQSPQWLAFQASASEIYTEWLLGTHGDFHGMDDEPTDYSELNAKMALLRDAYGWTEEATAEAEQACYSVMLEDMSYVERRDS